MVQELPEKFRALGAPEFRVALRLQDLSTDAANDADCEPTKPTAG